MEKNVDVVIIGAGSAGLYALAQVRRQTENFVLINDGPLGTTCARVGCMPSKALIEIAKAHEHERNLRRAMGISSYESESLDLSVVMKRVRDLRDRFVGGILSYTKGFDKHLISGRAHFLEPNVVEVNGVRYRARAVVLATGSRPVVPQAWSAFGKRVLTTDEIFEMETLPPRIGIVGLGVIGSEIGEALAQLGVHVTGVEATDRIAGISDPLVLDAFTESLKKRMDVWLGSRVSLSEGENGAIALSDESGRHCEVDVVLAAMGRRPNLDHLGLENLGVDLQNWRTRLNPHTMQLGDLPIFVAGDASQNLPLLHEAGDDGSIAGWNAVRSTPEAFRRRIPLRIAFTTPQVVSVGQTFADLQTNQNVIIGANDFSSHPRALTMGENEGLMRIYADSHTGVLLGAEIAGPRAEHIGHWLALAIQTQQSVSQLLTTQPFYHPTLEEGLADALRDLQRQLPAFTERTPGLQKQ